MAESRLKELEESTNERAKLKEEIHHLREQVLILYIFISFYTLYLHFNNSFSYKNNVLKIKNLPEDRIIESQVYRNLQVQYFHCKDNLDYIRTAMEQNNREMEKMTATRNSATNQIQVRFLSFIPYKENNFEIK